MSGPSLPVPFCLSAIISPKRAGGLAQQRILLRLLVVCIVSGSIWLPAAAQTANSARELLEVAGIASQQLDALPDDQPWRAEQQEVLYRILYRLGQIPPTQLRAWAQPAETLAAAVAHPAEHRLQVYHLAGPARRVEPLRLPADTARRLGFDHIFRLTVAPQDGSPRLIVYCRQIPQAWNAALGQDGAWTPQPIATDALFLQRLRSSDENVALVFAAAHLAWHPDRVQPQLQVSESDVLLSQAGMDLGLLDQVRHAQPLRAEDRASFYHLLEAVERIDPLQLQQHATPTFDIRQLLKQPHLVAGQLLEVTGTARRALRILVDDPEVRQQFGLDHYYELEVFVPLAQPLKLIDADEGTEQVYQTYPFVFCVRHLPADMPQGAVIHQPVRVRGFFCKLWAYDSTPAAAAGDETAAANPGARRQLSPLLIGMAPQPVEPPSREGSRRWGIAAGGGFIALLLVLGGVLWRVHRADRRWEQQLRQRDRQAAKIAVPEPPDEQAEKDNR